MMSKTKRSMLRHALGLPNDKKRSYRNFYTAPKGTICDDEWQEMVLDGYAEKINYPIKKEHMKNYQAYRLTPLGARIVLNPGETLCPEDFPSPAHIT